MALRIYNTLTRKKEELDPIHEGEVRMYVCGVTVYDYSHVGHARSAISFDVVYRYLQHLRYKVTFVKNYTDVDDNIINRAAERGVPWTDITREFIRAFDDDMEALHVQRPTIEPKATEHIGGMIELIKKLIDAGKAYAAESGNVYFSVREFPDYGCLSGRKVEDMRSGTRVELEEDKRDPLDFALWKAAKPGEPEWDSPWGKGRPGWHIECSVMSTHFLGQPFDIHGGGNDLIFPHHENEIAQSQAASPSPMANIWMHNGMLTINDEKMSKSLDNFFTIRDVLERYEAEALRMLYLSSHYRSPVDFSDQALDEHTDRVERLYRAVAEVENRAATAGTMTARVGPAEGPDADEARLELSTISDKFREAMDDDFNTAAALAVLFEAVRSINRMGQRRSWSTGDQELAHSLATRVSELAGVLGFMQEEPMKFLNRVRDRRARANGVDPGWVVEQIERRAAARKRKDYKEADAVRDELIAKGVQLEDTPRGTTWRFVGS